MSQMRQPKPDWGGRGTVPKGKAGPKPPPNGRTVATRPCVTRNHGDLLYPQAIMDDPETLRAFTARATVRPATRGERLRLWIRRVTRRCFS